MSSVTPTVVVVDVSADSASSPGGIYQFNPASITASNGTIVSFRFSGIPGNHSVTQSTFGTPCQRMANGFDSGFIEARETVQGVFPTWNHTVKNDQYPAWFYCRQTTPTSHCHAGMVAVINVDKAQNTLDDFRAKALQSSPASSSSNSPAAVKNSAATTSTLTVAPSTPSTSAVKSGAKGNRTSSASPPVGAIVGAVVGVVAFIGLCVAALMIFRRRRRRRVAVEIDLEDQMQPRPLILNSQEVEKAPSLSGTEDTSMLSTILREVRSIRRQMRGTSRADEPPPVYTDS
ncbi:hypothetical protein B0H16DRAFT_1635381 [Mycena metata]|uniref:Extracellular serine-rich protein n=1 Tax=Mycena metata TaxID=1033252 RepID=A0AAD7GW41_9AGAR|nr:hypothetical protein B0H16DRAFT_1635381 [Mycena metata]